MFFVQLGCALQQTRVEIEHITREGLTTGWASEQQRHLAISDGLLGEIVVNNKRVFSIITEVLTNSASGVWSQELQRSSLRSSSGNDDGILEAITVVKQSHDVRDSRTLLADSDVDAIKRLGVITKLVDFLLVYNGVDSDGGLTGLSVSDDKLTLSSADRDLQDKLNKSLCKNTPKRLPHTCAQSYLCRSKETYQGID